MLSTFLCLDKDSIISQITVLLNSSRYRMVSIRTCLDRIEMRSHLIPNTKGIEDLHPGELRTPSQKRDK